MKKALLSLLFIFSVYTSALSQELSYGLKAGINYSRGGQVTGESSGEGNWAETLPGTSKTGFQGGIFAQINFGRLFIRPEVVYTSLEREFDFPRKPALHAVEKFEVPLLAGYNIWGPVEIYAGPVYSNILNSEMILEQGDDPHVVVVQNTPINAQAGVTVWLGRFGLDLRYEHSLSAAQSQPEFDFNEGVYGVNLVDYEDATFSAIKLSLMFKIGGPGLNEGGRFPCY